MSTALSQFGEIEVPELPAPPEALTGIRGHVALVRALLDELERLVPYPARRSPAAWTLVLEEQLAEEFGRLGLRIIECAAAMSAASSKPAAGP